MSPLFSDADLAAFRELNRDNLDLLATVSRKPAAVRGPGGSYTEQPFAPVAGLIDVPCRLRIVPGTLGETLNADQLKSAARWLVTFEEGVRVRASDRITVRGIVSGVPWTRELEVAGELGPESFPVMSRVLCRDVT